MNELHPLLKRLLPKLPDVIEVEYTHGGAERGADFVLTRTHNVFDLPEYIGVVVKVGKVVQNYSDIERQIEECGLPRPVSGARKKVRLNEIWVITTEHITKGAQEKIHDKYEKTKIHFLPGERLAALIDKHMPDFWSAIPLEFGEYLTTLRGRNAETDIKVSLVKGVGASLYVDQDIDRKDEGEYQVKGRPRKPKKNAPVDFLNEIEQRTVLLVEGGMGAGKAKLLRHLVEHYTTPEVFLTTKRLPIHVSFKEFVDDFGADLDKLVTARLAGKISTDMLASAVPLVLIDGVDEKALPLEDQMEILRELGKATAAKPGMRVVVTSRYLNNLDSRYSLGQDVARYEVRPLSFAKVIEFITALCSRLNVHTRILEDLKKSQLFKELPRSPIAVILLAQLLNENDKDLPSNMTELYSKYVELMLGRWDIEKGLQSQKEYEALDNILMQLAKYTIENELEAASVGDTRQLFASYLSERNLGIEPADLFQRAVSRSEIIALDAESNSVVFKHRTFAEYLYARLLAKEGNLRVDERVFQVYWMNTFFFMLGIKRDSPALLRDIISLVPEEEGELLLRLANLGNYLLAAYSTPYAVTTEGITRAAREAAEYYVRIVSGKSDSIFSRLPRMAVLHFFQYFMRQAYSYPFFQTAVEEAALTIDASDMPQDTKGYAIFFLNVIYMDLGATQSFDFLLEKHSTALPLDIMLAIGHEGEQLKQRSDLMKKQDRRIRRLLRADQAVKRQLEDMYKRPIKAAKALPPPKT